MLFAMICRDRPGSLDVRLANRDAHLAYAHDSGAVVFGGPMLDEAGGMVGSLVVIEVEDRAAAEAFAAADPYGRAGLFESVEIVAWKRVIG
ncbi:MAG: YciI family protein [Rhodobacteraceae bacterium]|nr:MAG: YciI family protein [Paracoccaceae bacterium]